MLDGWKDYHKGAALTLCVEGSSYYRDTHGEMHLRQGVVHEALKNSDGLMKYEDAVNTASKAHQVTFPEAECKKECLDAQIKHNHEKFKDGDNDDLRATYPMASDENRHVNLTHSQAREQMGIGERRGGR